MRILVIEDDSKIREFLKVSLQAECFAVDVAEDGEEGLYLARINDYDIIILDNLLPKKSGLEVCTELRAFGKSTPILVLSVKQEIITKVDFLNKGADDYLTKPFSFAELLARIHALLRRPREVEGELLEIDDLTLDTKRNIVMRAQKEVTLTRKEFMLLEYLMKNQEVVLSRGMIMEHVWDMNADPFSNTIESHILSLRRKVEGNGQCKIIQTVQGRGYKVSL